MLENLKAWRKNKNCTIKTGIELIKEADSKYTTYFRENENAEVGSMPFNLLDARVDRLIRIETQNAKKKEDTKDTPKTQEQLEAEIQQALQEEATRLINLAKSAKTKAEKAEEKAEQEQDQEKKKELEEKAMIAMQKAEDALKKANDFSAQLNKE